jgi:hypothetical protein
VNFKHLILLQAFCIFSIFFLYIMIVSQSRVYHIFHIIFEHYFCTLFCTLFVHIIFLHKIYPVINRRTRLIMITIITVLSNVNPALIHRIINNLRRRNLQRGEKPRSPSSKHSFQQSSSSQVVNNSVNERGIDVGQNGNNSNHNQSSTPVDNRIDFV